jgi:hypothetical protein
LGWFLIGLIDLVLWDGFMYVVLDDFGLIFGRILVGILDRFPWVGDF